MDYKKDRAGKFYRSGLSYRAHDCSDNSVMVRQFVTYKEDGSVIHSSDVYSDGWQFVIPDSIGSAIQNFVCNHELGAGSVTKFSVGGIDFLYVDDPGELLSSLND